MQDRFKSRRHQLPGNTDMCHRTDWRMLPEELVELILSKLPLVDLARVSATSRIFQAVFRRELAREQQACCDCGVERFGRERISTLIQLINCVLKGEGLNIYMVRWWEVDFGHYIHRDGTCHTGMPLSCEPASQITHAGDTQVQFWVSEESEPLSIHVVVQDGDRISLAIFVRLQEVGRLMQPSSIGVYGMEEVPVVQALLSEGLAQMFHDAGHQVEVKILRGQNSDVTQAGFKAVVAPLMPFITSRRFRPGEVVGLVKQPTSR